MEKLAEKTKVRVPSKAKIRVVWEDNPENYTQERSKRIAKYITEKYGNNNVQVVFKPKKVITEEGEVEMTVADNVMDITYQRKLFKEWLDSTGADQLILCTTSQTVITVLNKLSKDLLNCFAGYVDLKNLLEKMRENTNINSKEQKGIMLFMGAGDITKWASDIVNV